MWWRAESRCIFGAVIARCTWLVVGLVGACAVRGETAKEPVGATGAAEFPTAAELAAIAARPVAPVDRGAVREVQRWALAGPLPTKLELAPHSATTPAGVMVVGRFAGDPRVLPVSAMECVAREHGRFWLAHQAAPSDELATFVQARCGAPVGRVEVRVQGAAGVGGAGLTGRWNGEAETSLAKLPRERHAAVGLWSGEADGRSVVAAAYAVREVDVDPIAMDAGADGAIVVRGRFLADVGGATAVATRGALGVVACESIAETPLPSFAFRCAVDGKDAAVTIEVSAVAPGRRLAGRVLLGMFAPGRALAGEYAAPGVAGDAKAAGLLAAINRVRARAGVGALQEAAAESAVAARVLPQYFGGDAATAGTIALGSMAGWEIEGRYGTLRSGAFAAMRWSGVMSVDRAIEGVLRTPVNRAVLLDPDAEIVALATAGRGAETAAIVTTYRIYKDAERETVAAGLLDRLDAERAAAGKTRVIRLRGSPTEQPLSRACARIRAGTGPNEALGGALEHLEEDRGVRMGGLVLQGDDLATATFPAELLYAKSVQVDVAVDHHRPAGRPWGTWVALLLFRT